MSVKKKILVFDGQVFQTPAWHRGMGKYSLELVSALNSLNMVEKNWSEIVILLSSKFSVENSVIESLKKRTPGVRVIKLDFSHNEYDNRPVASRNRKVLDTFLSERIQKLGLGRVDYIILSLMQSEVAPTFSSLEKVHNYLLFYDIIPLMFHKTYLPDAINQKGYLSKLAELLRADTYLAISKTVANDLAGVLGISPERIVSIDGAPIAHGQIATPIEVPKPFILMPTGNDLRKNNRRGVEAFAKFNNRHRNKYHLIVTSTFQSFEIEEYRRITDKVVFTGNITGEELEYLYQETAALLFPTEYEGLGMPILEALEKDKPVACSDISVFQEMSSSAFFYFDPTNSTDIANALTKAVTTKILPMKEYKKVLGRYTWQHTARLFYDCARSSKSIERATEKPELIIASAAVDETLHSADMQQLYSELSRLCTVSYYMDFQGKENKQQINYVSQITNTANIGHFPSPNIQTEGRPIYFIENSANCAAVLITALANPGVLVLMDSSLEKLWEGAVRRRFVHPTRFAAEKKLNESLKSAGLLASLIASQKVVITFSENMKNKLEGLVVKLPDPLKPEVYRAHKPGPELVYGELRQNLSSYDYPGHLKDPGPGGYSDFARLLVQKSYEEGNDE